MNKRNMLQICYVDVTFDLSDVTAHAWM